MPQDSPHQPHDKLFKAGFGDPPTAAGFLSWQLPTALANVIDWGRLRLEAGSFVDPQFRHSESDLLFSVPIHGQGCLIYILFEHLRSFDPWMALRLLRYMVRIWETRLRGKPSKLPVIVPVVLAQNDRRWELNPEFASLLEVPPNASEFVPNFAFRLVQLAEIPFERIAGTPSGILLLRVLKAERTGDLLGNEVWDETLISEAGSIFPMVLSYLLGRDIDKDAFSRRVQSLHSPEIKETAMTLAQQFHQEGHQEGHQKGRQEGILLGQRRAVLDALAIRFGPVPEEIGTRLDSITDPSRLEALHRTAIRCEDLEGFQRDL